MSWLKDQIDRGHEVINAKIENHIVIGKDCIIPMISEEDEDKLNDYPIPTEQSMINDALKVLRNNKLEIYHGKLNSYNKFI